MRRPALLGVAIAVVVASAAVGWVAGSRIRSPAEVAAAAEPPEPSNITVEVERVELSADVVTRGDIVYDQPVAVSLSGSFADQPEALVVTDVAAVDSEIAEGGRAVEVAGNPVFFLTGEIPMYRDLRPGSSGVDVQQLEQALARLGFFAGTPNQQWADDTGAAVAAWYADAGYRPNGLTDEEEDALTAARDRVSAARLSLADAEQSLTGAGAGGGRAERLSAQSQLDAALAALDLAELDAAGAIGEAEEAATATQRRLDTAAYARLRAEQRLADETASGAGPGRLAELEEAVTEARAEQRRAQREHDANVDALRRVRIEQGALVRQAEDAVAIARATISDLDSGFDTSALRRAVDLARQEVARAEDDLGELEAELGTWLPAGEVVFLPRMPVRVNSVAAERGSVITDTFMTVSGSDLTIRSSVSEPDATRLGPGQPVEIENPEDPQSPIFGTVGEVADRAGTNNAAADRIALEIVPDGAIPESVIGQNVRITIPISSTGGAVLAVPAAALSATSDGSTIVQVDEDGELRTVEVEAGLAADGLVEVTPVDGALEEGDLVVVGLESGE